MLRKNRLYWTIQFAGWSLYAILEIVTSAVASDEGVGIKRVVFLCIEAVFCLILTHLFRQLINHWQWLNLGLAKLIPRIMAGVLVMSLVMYLMRVPASIVLGMFMPGVLFSAETVLGLSAVYTVMFFMWSVLYLVYNYFERFNTSLKLEASVREIELNNLKSQLNPHFIFNALNSIRSLIDENPAKSKLAVTQLSNLLRSSLTTGKKGLTPLEEELKIVQDYLGLETIRFEERLTSQFDIDPQSLDFLVPPLMIQTLVENGIKHGVSRLKEGGVIQVKTRVEADRLNIQIRNTGQYVNGVKRSTGGLGLENTRQRLKLIYGGKASFKIMTENNNFVLTQIEIPHVS
jgi:two-component system LytT family sensor kinase